MPLIATFLTAMRSLGLPVRMSILECCCKLCPSPGILTLIGLLFNIFAFATRLLAEFGFLGDIVSSFKQMAFLCGVAFGLYIDI